MEAEQTETAMELVIPEEPEGLGSSEDDETWGDYPIDTVLIRNEARTIHDIVRRIRQNSFIMDPDFQRDFIWNLDKQSRLIESVLLRIPLPVFYLAEDSEGRMIVVDGLQRLSTFRRFLDNELTLKLPGSPDLNKKKFQDLSPKLQNRVEDCNLILYIVDSKVPERARLDIFERVNSGEPLSRQQMRNCLFTGKATDFLKTESKSDEFIKATGGTLNAKTMRDREFVNRFCAFQLLGIETYKEVGANMDEFLALALRTMNSMENSEIENLSKEFRVALNNNYALFDKHAFRKAKRNSDRRSVLNAALWDVMSTQFSKITEGELAEMREKFTQSYNNLMDDPEFVASITSGTNGLYKTLFRFSKILDIFLNSLELEGVIY
jgi:hypothetical protein